MGRTAQRPPVRALCAAFPARSPLLPALTRSLRAASAFPTSLPQQDKRARSGTQRLYYTSKQTGGETNPETHWGKTRNPPGPEKPRPGSRFSPRPPLLPPPKSHDGPRRTNDGGKWVDPGPVRTNDRGKGTDPGTGRDLKRGRCPVCCPALRAGQQTIQTVQVQSLGGSLQGTRHLLGEADASPSKRRAGVPLLSVAQQRGAFTVPVNVVHRSGINPVPGPVRVAGVAVGPAQPPPRTEGQPVTLESRSRNPSLSYDRRATCHAHAARRLTYGGDGPSRVRMPGYLRSRSDSDLG